MILQALVDYYEKLASKGEISRPGWAITKISYALEISTEGELLSILPLKVPNENGKKMIPREFGLPAPEKRTVGVAANFLWDNAMYMLGLDTKGDSERVSRCFEAAKERHLTLLGEVDDPFAKAICGFFSSWDISVAAENPHVAEIMEDLSGGSNLVFMFNRQFPSDNSAISGAWQRHYDSTQDGEKMRCLITGEDVVPEATHPTIKNVRDAQSSGAALVSFNAASFCSYEREQNLNAPIGKYAAFAYTTALNHLLADRSNVVYIGDATVVFWVESAEAEYQNAFLSFINREENGDDTLDLQGIMDKLAKGEEADWNGIPLDPSSRFYVLGLSPNASRISVRFFLRDSFGNFAKHSKTHYERLNIAKPEYEKQSDMPLWKLMKETVNPNANDKKSSPQMSGDTLRAILTGGRYPATLYQSIQLRIRADRKISYRRAALIKAYLLRNTSNEAIEEVLTVKLNDQTTYQPYVLGRMFALLEGIQERANPGINATIKDKYLSSACATPAKIFPILLNLSAKHLRKLDTGINIYYSKQMGELTALITDSYPAHHNIEDQGIFQLGYYHQLQKRYEKKTDPAENKEVNENE